MMSCNATRLSRFHARCESSIAQPNDAIPLQTHLRESFLDTQREIIHSDTAGSFVLYFLRERDTAEICCLEL